MKKTIGVVCEGPTDYLVIRTVVNKISGEDNCFREIQPSQDAAGRFGNGWKGVWRWCEKEKNIIPSLFDEEGKVLDAIIIHMDGDVSRKEKEPHCLCSSVSCEEKDRISPLACKRVRDSCPVILPCPDHEESPQGYYRHLNNLIRQLSGTENDKSHIIVMVPCDSTDTWIVSAYGDAEDPENIQDPWKEIISQKKEYHEVRIHRSGNENKKSVVTYEKFMKALSNNWGEVVKQCYSARTFDRDIRSLFLCTDECGTDGKSAN